MTGTHCSSTPAASGRKAKINQVCKLKGEVRCLQDQIECLKGKVSQSSFETRGAVIAKLNLIISAAHPQLNADEIGSYDVALLILLVLGMAVVVDPWQLWSDVHVRC